MFLYVQIEKKMQEAFLELFPYYPYCSPVILKVSEVSSFNYSRELEYRPPSTVVH